DRGGLHPRLLLAAGRGRIHRGVSTAGTAAGRLLLVAIALSAPARQTHRGRKPFRSRICCPRPDNRTSRSLRAPCGAALESARPYAMFGETSGGSSTTLNAGSSLCRRAL